VTAARQIAIAQTADDRALWFWHRFLPDWLARVQDGPDGVFDALDVDGRPAGGPRGLLAQARMLFTLSHLALVSGDAGLARAAGAQAAILRRFRKAPGLYRRALTRDGAETGVAADAVARSYDQTFVLLALVTYDRLDPAGGSAPEAERVWQALTGVLTDPATGLLLEDDGVADPAAADAPRRAQNPHMHLYEACLQAFEMSGRAVWLDRAAKVRALALQHFLDPTTGSVFEFLAPDLSPDPVSADRREIGHQCEWAWLLWREADLARDPAPAQAADRIMDFALRHGFVPDGPMAGAVFDAVSADGTRREETFLLWPQTEAIKALSTLHMAGRHGAGDGARQLLSLMVDRWFAGRPAFVNQLDRGGAPLWPEALTRLVYHVALALTEGARAGVWP
jgi:mannose/cellobiose epimerase-like protein (N-acyl-D-glucosamine 2-epimerase family)